MKLTGERPIEGKTPSSLLALHAAGYDAVIDRLGSGRVLDLGCGLGDESVRLGGPGRSIVGIDYDPVTAGEAARSHAGLVTACADGAVLPLRGESFDMVCSSHLIEHFVDPEHHVAEISRVLTSQGSAFFLTPNKPADFENPYHVYLFDPDDLARMLGRHFDDVTVFGLDGDAAVKADFERRRKLARRLLAIDVLGLRHRLPRSAYVALHATARRLAYPVLATIARARRGRGTPEPVITAAQFSLTSDIDRSTLVLFAVARRPRRRAR